MAAAEVGVCCIGCGCGWGCGCLCCVLVGLLGLFLLLQRRDCLLFLWFCCCRFGNGLEVLVCVVDAAAVVYAEGEEVRSVLLRRRGRLVDGYHFCDFSFFASFWETEGFFGGRI